MFMRFRHQVTEGIFVVKDGVLKAISSKLIFMFFFKKKKLFRSELILIKLIGIGRGKNYFVVN